MYELIYTVSYFAESLTLKMTTPKNSSGTPWKGSKMGLRQICVTGCYPH